MLSGASTAFRSACESASPKSTSLPLLEEYSILPAALTTPSRIFSAAASATLNVVPSMLKPSRARRVLASGALTASAKYSIATRSSAGS